MTLGQPVRRSTAEYSVTSSPHGEFLSLFSQIQLTKRSRLTTPTLLKETAVTVSGEPAQDLRLTIGAVHGSAAQLTPITQISLLIS